MDVRAAITRGLTFRRRGPILVLAAALAVTCAAMGWLAWSSFDHYQAMLAVERAQRILDLQGTVLQVNDTLTMSARMAAATGDPLWRQRHGEGRPRLDRAISELLELAPEYPSLLDARQTAAANQRVQELERAAFELVDAGRRTEALELLQSTEYEEQKSSYSAGIVRTHGVLAVATADALTAAKQRAHQNLTVMAVIVPVLVLGFVVMLRAAGRWQRAQQAIDTELRQRSEELKQLNETLEAKVIERTRQTRAILDAAGDGIFGFDRERRVRFANQAAERLLGWTAADLRGQPVATILEGDAGRCTGELCEGRFVRKDGTVFTGEFVCAPILDEQSQPGGGVVSFRDVTARRTLQAQLAQAQKLEAIGQLAAGIAHEINTPTQYIGDNVRFLKDAFREITAVLEATRTLDAAGSDAAALDSLREAWQRSDFDFLARECPVAIEQSLEGIERVTKIVYSMKEFAHPDRSEKVFVDLHRVVQSAITLCRNEWKYVAELTTELAPDLPLVPCFPGDVGQVLVNLIVNAAHAIADVVGDGGQGQGRIVVSTRHDGDAVELAVRDSGSGIPPAHRGRIFEQFFTTKPVGKGSGQGLALARRIVVEKHGGTIRFDSEVGRGTTFVVRLPLAGAPAVAPAGAAP
jgi:PAS domain S-box-containing protein